MAGGQIVGKWRGSRRRNGMGGRDCRRSAGADRRRPYGDRWTWALRTREKVLSRQLGSERALVMGRSRTFGYGDCLGAR